MLNDVLQSHSCNNINKKKTTFTNTTTHCISAILTAKANMSNLFFHRPKTKHELKMANLSARFRQKPSQPPDPFTAQNFTLCHIGKSAVSKSHASGLGGVHRLLIEYYLFFLKVMTRESLSLTEYMKRSPSFKRHLTVKKGTLVVKFKRHRRPPSDGMLINEEQIYCGEQIVYCDCFCFEVVLPTGLTAAKLNEPEVCYAYFRQASDCRRAIPESSLFPLDRELSNWFLRNRHYPRPPIVVCLLGPSRVSTSLFCHIFVADTVDMGLQFVKTVVNYTYGLKDDYRSDSRDRYGNHLHGRPGTAHSNYQQGSTSGAQKNDGPLRPFQRRVTRKPSRSQSPYTRKQQNYAPLSGKNGRSMLFAPGMASIQPSSSANVNNMEDLDDRISESDSQNNYKGPMDPSKMLSKLQLHGNSKWLTSSTPALIISPISNEDFEPIRQRLLQFQIAQEASCVRNAKRVRSGRSNRHHHEVSRRAKSSDRHLETPNSASSCQCSSCSMREQEQAESGLTNAEDRSMVFRAPKHFYFNRSEEYLNRDLL